MAWGSLQGASVFIWGLAFSGLGDIPPEDADLPASSGLEGEPASRFPLGTPAGSKRTRQIRSASGLRSPRPTDTVPAPPLDGFLRDIPSVLRAAIQLAGLKSVGWGHGRDGPSGRGGFSPTEADFEEIRARMSERRRILDQRYFRQGRDIAPSANSRITRPPMKSARARR